MGGSVQLSSEGNVVGRAFAARLKDARFFFLTAVTVIACSRWASGNQFDIVIDEINYDPFTSDERDEFVEIHNRGPTPVDLSGWEFTEGIAFHFPDGTLLGPSEHLVLSPDASHMRARYGIQNVLGNYTGRLNNDGENLALADAGGNAISRIHYGVGDPWPSHPGGIGPTLELISPYLRNDLPQNWASSKFLEGTPGRRNSGSSEHIPARSTIISAQDAFRTFKGLDGEPSSPSSLWTQRGFDDSGWSEMPGPFGVGGYSVSTELTDLPGAYTTYSIRRTFDVDADTLAELRSGVLRLILDVRYDDGFVAFVNGVEVGRMNLGSPGTPVPHNGTADSFIEDGATTIDLNIAGLLVAAGNVLAVQCANGSLDSTDLLIAVDLVLAPNVEEVKRTVVINEVRPSEPPGSGFIELYNRTEGAVDVGGWWVVDSLGLRCQIPAPRFLDPGALLLIQDVALGFPISLSGRYALVEPDGVTWVDGMNPKPGPIGASFGRFPDGDEDDFVLPSPTPGGPNELTLEKNIVINEFLYHPPFVTPDGECQRQCSDEDQWIELHNRGTGAVDVSWWSLSKGVEFSFPDGAWIAAQGYLVIAADPARFLARHPGLHPDRILGSWTKSLSRSTDTINLNDALGNRVDHVKYGDGKPTNDEDPKDGIDDGTIAASEWRREADDGGGRSLELVNPALDNRAGAAWAAGPEGGTPLARNSVYLAAPPPIAWDIEIEPAVPRSNDQVLVTCRASAVSAIVSVDLGTTVGFSGWMRDDGRSGDKAAGDGIYGVWIPPQASRTVVAFGILVSTSTGAAIYPRPHAIPPYPGAHGPSYLYQVDDAVPPPGALPAFRIIMTAADRQELLTRSPTSNVLLPCTFIGDGKAFHHVGIRLRGEKGRSDLQKSYRINFPPERKFRGVEHMDLIAEDIETEVLASDLFRRANIPCIQEWTVTLVFDGLPAGSALYSFKEVLDGDFLNRHFGGSSGGNLYKAESVEGSDPPIEGDLSYRGPAVNEEYRGAYTKESNNEEDDYSDLIELCRTFDPVETPVAVFSDRLGAIIDADEWARFFAVQSCLANVGNSIATDDGEGYFLYKVPADSPRYDAGKWLILPWDIEETFDGSDSRERLFRPDIPAIRRFLANPAFAPLYWANLRDLQGGAFSRAEMREQFYLIEGSFPESRLDALDAYVASRDSFFEEEVHRSLTAGIDALADYLVKLGDDWKYFKGESEPSGGTTAWTSLGFPDGTWLEGPTAIGYGEPGLATVLDDMRGSYVTVYARKVFQVVASPFLLGKVILKIDYDDGFVAYLNGNEVARRNAPGDAGSFVPFDALALDARETGSVYEEIDLSPGDLRMGGNVLAIQVFNRDIDSSDLSLFPMLLTRKQAGAGCGNVLYAFSDKIDLAGHADAGRTWRVEVNGGPALYSPSPSAEWTASLEDLPPGESRVQVRTFDHSGVAFDSLELTILRITLANRGGALTADTVWSASAGPYLMSRDVIVPSNVKLTIEKGTTVIMQGGLAIIVHGELEAEGTADEPIRFRSYSCTDPLGGFIFAKSGTGPGAVGRLVHVDIESGGKPAGYEGTVALVDSEALIEDCVFRRLDATAIHSSGARVEVSRTLFEDVRGALTATASEAIIADSTLRRMTGGSDAIVLGGEGPGGARSRIEGCRIEGGSGTGIRLASASADMEDNALRGFQDMGISISGNGPDGASTLKGTLIFECGTGITLLDGADLTGDHDTVAGNQEGMCLADGAPCTFDSSILWDNVSAVLDPGSTAHFVRSDIPDFGPGDGNISGDPRFVSPITGDYSLGAGSPAIGSGKDGTDMGAIPYVGRPFIRGDADRNGAIDVTDAKDILEYLFGPPQEDACSDRLDGNDDGEVNISDPIFLLFYLFEGGPEPASPFPGPGVDPTGDGLLCS
jgi:spore coat protein CotH